MTVKRYTPTQCCEHDGTYVTYSDYQKLVAENARMREAIEFATAPDMWQEQHDGMLDYRYVDVLNAALEPKSTDAAIAEIKAQGVDEWVLSLKGVNGWTVNNAREFAANLRAGRKG